MRIISKTIAIGETQTDPINLSEQTFTGFTTGSVISASAVTFLVSLDGENFFSLYDKNTEVAVLTGSYTRSYAVDPVLFYPWSYVKIREGTDASAVAQATYPAVFECSLRNYQRG